jgi:hypothetical protein
MRPESVAASVAANERWAAEPDRYAATQAARDGRWRRYLERARELAPEGSPPEEIQRRAESLRKADMQRMALASVKARRKKGGSDAA